jgi:ornithine carbamoyltransferase
MVSPTAQLPASDFITGEELDREQLLALLERAEELKRGREDGVGRDSLRDRSVALVFEKPSTRTRVSFEVGVAELGATPIVLRADELQMTRGESISDTARILSGYLHGIVIRSGSDERVRELAEGATVPVINGLTPQHHPCQALADLLTLKERFGDLEGLRLAYVGDGNNVARSLAILGRIAGVDDPRAAAAGADAVYTDVWVSMGDEEEAAKRRSDLAPYQLNDDLLDAASDRVVALHCLPAHPGEEITAGVLYGERSAVWDQAENRLHAQKALLERLLV